MMSRFQSRVGLVAVIGMTTAGCKAPVPSGEPTVEVRPVIESKAEAPFELGFQRDGRVVAITVRSLMAAEQVRVLVMGTNGLKLVAEREETVGTMEANGERVFEVEIDPSGKNGLVTVVVESVVGGQRRGKTAAFEVGRRELERDAHRVIDGKREKDYRVDP